MLTFTEYPQPTTAYRAYTHNPVYTHVLYLCVCMYVYRKNIKLIIKYQTIFKVFAVWPQSVNICVNNMMKI